MRGLAVLEVSTGGTCPRGGAARWARAPHQSQGFPDPIFRGLLIVASPMADDHVTTAMGSRFIRDFIDEQ